MQSVIIRSSQPRKAVLSSIASLPGVVAVAAAYGVVQGAIRYGASPTIGIDDGTAAVFSQSWELGYVAKNPPLYDWLLKTLQAIWGPDLVSVLVLKYALLTAAAAFTYLAALRAIGDRRWAALTAFSLSLCYQIGWNYHEGMTHTAVLIPIIMATLWCTFRLLERVTVANCLALGVCVGLGFIAKYNFAVFVFSLAVACACVPPVRARFSDPRLLLAVIPIFLIAAPHAAWLLTRDVPRFVQHAIGPEVPSLAKRVLSAFVDLVKSPFGFLVPFGVVLPVLFPGIVKRLAVAIRSLGHQGVGNEAQRILLIFTLASLAIVFVSALVFGGVSGRVRYMHPFFLPAIILLMALAKEESGNRYQESWFATALVATCLVVVAVRVATLYLGPPYCGRCHPLERFEPLAVALEAAGADRGAIVTDDQFIAGNVRRLVPAPPVALVSKAVTYMPPQWDAATREQVTVILRSGDHDHARASELLGFVRMRDKLPAHPAWTERIVSPWTALFGTHFRKSEWTIATFKPDRPAAP